MDEKSENQLKGILFRLGTAPRYTGYHQMVQAVRYGMEDEGRLMAVTKEIYYNIAKADQCSWKGVERNLRTVVKLGWQTNSKYLSEMAGYKLEACPTVGEFIDILVNYLKRNSAV